MLPEVKVICHIADICTTGRTREQYVPQNDFHGCFTNLQRYYMEITQVESTNDL
jgi:hypothetical protein